VPPRAWNALLRDVLDRAARIEEYTRGLTFEEFEKDTLRIDAVLYNITIIGEAASQVPPEVQQRLALPWRQMRGMRNTIVHSYHSVRLKVVWETIKNDVPQIVPLLEAALAGSSDAPEHHPPTDK